jgi:SprT protein
MPFRVSYALLQRHVPPAALAYAGQLWERYPFSLRVSRPRRTRFGDYRYDALGGHRISVNADLPPPAFLLTYLHEVAHRIVYEHHGPRVPPHGAAWKSTFRDLLEPVLNEAIFGPDLLAALHPYARNPGATTAAHPALTLTLRAPHRAGPSHPDTAPLATLPEGTLFELNGRQFRRGPLRRTRYLCTEQASGRRYAVAAGALVRKTPDFR